MSDDQGWGDTGYNGHPVLNTPHLDTMAREGIRFNRFYSGAPVCSPTRGSCLTGRHPYRYGIFGANRGHLKKDEVTLAAVLKEHGYATGHFGKWHLGTLSPDFSGKGPRRKPEENYMTPGMSGFDEWFSTEYAVATWDPYDPNHLHGSGAYDTRKFYWHNGENVTEVLTGDDSRIIMDRAIPFIQNAIRDERPFFAVIWFHAPHTPVYAGPEFLQMYPAEPENKQHYYGCITAMDVQIGRLRQTLNRMGEAENTMLWFCSDNGPARQGSPKHVGSPGPFRGFKTALYEGGIRVPSLLVWPSVIRHPKSIDMACSTSDYFPTILDILDVKVRNQPEPVDGVSLRSVIQGAMTQRPSPIAFEHGKQLALIDNRFKLISTDSGETWALYDLLSDPSETTDLATKEPEIVQKLKKVLMNWRASCEGSRTGADYL